MWSSPSRRITKSAANLRDRDQRKHVYNERLQLVINGNVLCSRKLSGKIRFQFPGIRVKEPPAGPSPHGSAGSDMMVSRFDQITEINQDPNLRRHQSYLGACTSLERTYCPLRPREEFDGTRSAQVRNFSFAIAGKPDRGRLSCNKLQESTFDRGAWDPSGKQRPR